MLSWALWSALASDPTLWAEGPHSRWAAYSLCNGFIPLPTDFPEETAAWEHSRHWVSAQILDWGLRGGKEVSLTLHLAVVARSLVR